MPAKPTSQPNKHSNKIQCRYELSGLVCQMMSKRTLVTLGVVDESTLGTVDSFSRTFHVPFVTTVPPSLNVSTRAGYTLYLRPSYDQALLSVVRHYQWKQIVYVFDNDEGMIQRCSTIADILLLIIRSAKVVHLSEHQH